MPRHLAFRPLTVLCCLASLLCILLAGCAGARALGPVERPVVGPGKRLLRVMTFNVKSCTEGTDKVAAAIAQASPDVIALQEVDAHTDRSGGIDQARVLADRLGMEHVVHIPTTQLFGGDYGQALISRHPIVSLDTRPLPVDPGMEPRVVARAVLDVYGEEIAVYKVHLSALPQRSRLRAEQARMVARLLRAEERPTILLGDLNDVASSAAVRLLSTGMQDAWLEAGVGSAGTYPLPLVGALRYDYVLASPDFEVRRAYVQQGNASDHHPVIADLVLPSATYAAADEDHHQPPAQPVRRR